MVVLKSGNIVLRPFSAADAGSYLECHNDREAARNFMSVPKNIREAKKEIGEKHGKALFLAIEVGGELAGFVNLELNNSPKHRHSAIIGYGLIKRFRGRGIATKAVSMVTNYGFKRLKLRRISGMCRTFNRASARVLKKCGYRLEGILRKNKFKDGKYLDDMLWAKVR